MTQPDPDRLGESFALRVAPPPPRLATAIGDAAVISTAAGVLGAVTIGRGLLAAAAAAVGAAVHIAGHALRAGRTSDVPAAVRYADTVWEGYGTDAAAAALVVWEHLQRTGELPPSAVWVLVTDPGGEAPYAYRHARYLSELFVATEPVHLDGPADAPGWLAVVAPAVPADIPSDPDREHDAVTLADVTRGTRGRTRMVAVAVTQAGESGTVSAPLVWSRHRWAVGAITAADVADGPDVNLAPWLATIAGTTLHTPEDGTR